MKHCSDSGVSAWACWMHWSMCMSRGRLLSGSSMLSLHRLALVASLITPLVAAPALAQERTRVGGRVTMTPDRVDQVQILTTRRARLGITINLLASSTDSIGALIVGVTPNGPAARAGLRSGDIIVRFNGRVM